MAKAEAQFPDGAADIARRFGITIKALRHYEEAGLISPVRDGNGWRTYGHAECARLHLIVLLRKLSMPVARIKAMLDNSHPDTDAALALQEQALIDQRAEADVALELVRAARARIADGGTLDRDALAALARRGAATGIRWTDAVAALAETTFTVGQRSRLADRDAALQADWAAVYDDLKRLMPGGDPASPEAIALAARARDLLMRNTDGDRPLLEAMTKFWQRAFAEPEVAPAMPISEAEWHFLGSAMAIDPNSSGA